MEGHVEISIGTVQCTRYQVQSRNSITIGILPTYLRLAREGSWYIVLGSWYIYLLIFYL